MAPLGVTRHHDVLLGVFHIGLLGRLLPGAGLHQALGVGDPGAHLQQHRGVKLLGNGIGQLGKGQGFLRICRLQHGKLGGHGIVAGILLVLGAVHPRVVRYADDHAGVYACIGDGKQGICRNVQAHVLHAAKAAAAGQGSPEGRLHGDFFIGRPFCVDLFILGGKLGNLRAGRAGIAGHHGASSLIKAPGRRFITEHQCFHGGSSLKK